MRQARRERVMRLEIARDEATTMEEDDARTGRRALVRNVEAGGAWPRPERERQRPPFDDDAVGTRELRDHPLALTACRHPRRRGAADRHHAEKALHVGIESHRNFPAAP